MFTNPTGTSFDFFFVDKGRTDCQLCPSTPETGEVCCLQSQPPTVDWQFSFARELATQTGCPPAGSGVGDQFGLQAQNQVASGCTFNMFHIEHYEVSLQDLSVVYGINLDALSAQDVLDRINGVELETIGGIDPAADFYCPSGWNRVTDVLLEGVGLSVERVIYDQPEAASTYHEYIRK